MDKILELQNPSYEGDEKIDPFDMWEGVNFRLNVSEVAGFPNYDKSKFDTRPSPIAESDEEIEKIWLQRHDLSEIVSPKAFKSYDELKERLNKVLGATSARSNFENFDEDEEEEKSTTTSKFDFSAMDEDEEEKPVSTKETKKSSPAPKTDDDDDLDFFKSLAN